jgi:hypothetical protein
MVTRIASMVLRLCALAALALGILFWTGNALQLREIHMTIGILLVLSLWTVAFAQIGQPGGIGMAAGAVVAGVLLFVVGVTQASILPGSAHWAIQVVHLALALAAVGLGEMIAGRATRAAKASRAIKPA